MWFGVVAGSAWELEVRASGVWRRGWGGCSKLRRHFRSNPPHHVHLPLLIAALFLAWPLVTGAGAPWRVGAGLAWFGLVAGLDWGLGQRASGGEAGVRGGGLPSVPHLPVQGIEQEEHPKGVCLGAVIDDLSMGSFVPTERDSIFVGPLESLVHAESLECPEKGFQ